MEVAEVEIQAGDISGTSIELVSHTRQRNNRERIDIEDRVKQAHIGASPWLQIYEQKQRRYLPMRPSTEPMETKANPSLSGFEHKIQYQSEVIEPSSLSQKTSDSSIGLGHSKTHQPFGPSSEAFQIGRPEADQRVGIVKPSTVRSTLSWASGDSEHFTVGGRCEAHSGYPHTKEMYGLTEKARAAARSKNDKERRKLESHGSEEVDAGTVSDEPTQVLTEAWARNSRAYMDSSIRARKIKRVEQEQKESQVRALSTLPVAKRHWWVCEGNAGKEIQPSSKVAEKRNKDHGRMRKVISWFARKLGSQKEHL
jgi:hypothetical protein